MKQIFLTTIAALALSFAAHSQTLNENFTEPFNPAAAGWIVTNNSGPTAGSVSWTQGNQTGGNGTITAYNGLTDDFYMADFVSVSSQGTISAWLITPTVSIYNGAVLEFATRTGSFATIYADRMQVRMAQSTVATIPAGASSVGNFTNLMLDINPNLVPAYASAVNNGTVNGYPVNWTVYQLVVSGVTGTVSGRFAFRYFVNNGGSNGANSRLVGIDAVKYTLPCQPAVADNYTTCAGSSTTLSALGVPANSYSWSTGSTASAIVVSPLATTVYTLVITNNGAPCPTPFTRTVTVGPAMALSVNASTTTICAGSPVLLSASGPADSGSFLWNVSGGSISTATIGTTTSVSPTVTTSYVVNALNGSCIGSATVNINVLALPSISVNITPVCVGGSYTVTASGAVLYSYLGSTVNPKVVSSPTAAGAYYFPLAGAGANGCIAGGNVTFTAYAPPTVNVAASKTIVCVNNTISLTASGADTYSWSSNASVTGTNSSYTFSATTTGLKTFSVVGTSTVSGCTAAAARNVSVTACTGIEDLAGNAVGTTVFPNPFNAELHVSALAGRVEIYNALGQLVITAEVSENAVINTAELSKGVYLVKALDRDGREVTTQRLLKN